jgi:hypothetical protein
MSQKIKIQDGIITYAASNPSDLLKFNVNGQLSVSDELTVGNDPLVDGTITSPPGANINIIPGSGANLLLSPGITGGQISINGISWPAGSADPTPGYFLGASALNVLEFYPFVLAYNPSDTLTVSDLNTQYPTIQPGQKVIGPTTVYECVSFSTWRILAAGITTLDGLSDVVITTPVVDEALVYNGSEWVNGPATTPLQTFVVRLLANPLSTDGQPNYAWVDYVVQSSADASWDSYTSQLSLDKYGLYKISITAQALLQGLPWPDVATTYGITILGALGLDSTQYFRGNAAVAPNNSWASMSFSAQQITWSDTFYYNINYGSGFAPIGCFVEMFDSTPQVTLSLIMSVQRIQNV